MPVLPHTYILNPDLRRPSSQNSVPRSTGCIWLDKNENLDPELLAVTTSILRNLDPACLALYPEFSALYKKLSAWIGVPPEAIMLTPGSDGAIRLTFEVFVAPRDVVVHTVPTFAMYPVYCQMFGATANPIEYFRGNEGPILDVQSLLNHILRVRPRLVCLPNPDSPTGTVFDDDALLSLINLCGSIGTVVLIDEAYHPFYANTCAQWTKQHSHLIIARTFAKAWGLAGLRIGYVIGHPATIEYFHKMRPMYEVGMLSALFMEQMLDHVDAMEASVSRIIEGKKFFVKQMQALGLKTIPTEGNFQHVAFGDHAELIHGVLTDIVLYRKDFKEDCLKGFSRFSMAPVDGLRSTVLAIQEAINKSKAHRR